MSDSCDFRRVSWFICVRSLKCVCERINVPGPRQLEVPGKKTLTKGLGEFCLFLFFTVMRKLLEPRTGNECLQSLSVGCREVQGWEWGFWLWKQTRGTIWSRGLRRWPCLWPSWAQKVGTFNDDTSTQNDETLIEITLSKQGVFSLRFFRDHSLSPDCKHVLPSGKWQGGSKEASMCAL